MIINNILDGNGRNRVGIDRKKGMCYYIPNKPTKVIGL